MSTKSNLLKLLMENQGRYLSGQKIGEELAVSRNAIWKAMNQLKEEGYQIESKASTGYRLKNKSNMLSDAGISGDLKYPCDLHVFDTIDSTNTFAKTLTIGNKPAFVVANKQTAGRGRLGRVFVSPAGTGLYLSICLKPDFDLDKALYVTMAAAVAVARAIDKVCGVRVKIKWVNDLFYNNKKICGILTEAQTNFETGRIDNLIVGIGINCFPGSFPEELAEIAGSISNQRGSFSRNELASEIFNQMMDIISNFQDKSFFTEYRTRCFILGKNIYIHPNMSEKAIKAKAIDIDDNGGLVVEYMEGRRMREIDTISTGEVSIRFDY